MKNWYTNDAELNVVVGGYERMCHSVYLERADAIYLYSYFLKHRYVWYDFCLFTLDRILVPSEYMDEFKHECNDADIVLYDESFMDRFNKLKTTKTTS